MPARGRGLIDSWTVVHLGAVRTIAANVSILFRRWTIASGYRDLSLSPSLVYRARIIPGRTSRISAGFLRAVRSRSLHARRRLPPTNTRVAYEETYTLGDAKRETRISLVSLLRILFPGQPFYPFSACEIPATRRVRRIKGLVLAMNQTRNKINPSARGLNTSQQCVVYRDNCCSPRNAT